MSIPDRGPHAENTSGAVDDELHDEGLDPVLASLFQLGNAEADAVAARIDTDAVLAAVLATEHRATEQRPPRRSTRFRTVLLAPISAALALWAAIASPLRPEALLVLLFVVAPGLLVAGWHRQARLPGTSGRTRVGRTVEDWSNQIDRQGRALARRADELAHRLDRIRHLENLTAAERQLCADLGLVDVTASVEDLQRSLHRATTAANTLFDRAAAGAVEAQRFARGCRLDAAAARAEYGRLPWTTDPRQIAADVDALLRELSICADLAGDLPLDIALARRGPDEPAATRAAEIADGIGVVRRQVQVLRRPLLGDCRQLLVAFDILHALVTAREIDRITSGPGSKLAATAAVAASTLPQPRRRRAAVRTAFLHAARPAARPSWRWIGSATAAALAEGFGRRAESRP
jgi:hypothetical protein